MKRRKIKSNISRWSSMRKIKILRGKLLSYPHGTDGVFENLKLLVLIRTTNFLRHKFILDEAIKGYVKRTYATNYISREK